MPLGEENEYAISEQRTDMKCLEPMKSPQNTERTASPYSTHSTTQQDPNPASGCLEKNTDQFMGSAENEEIDRQRSDHTSNVSASPTTREETSGPAQSQTPLNLSTQDLLDDINLLTQNLSFPDVPDIQYYASSDFLLPIVNFDNFVRTLDSSIYGFPEHPIPPVSHSNRLVLPYETLANYLDFDPLQLPQIFEGYQPMHSAQEDPLEPTPQNALTVYNPAVRDTTPQTNRSQFYSGNDVARATATHNFAEPAWLDRSTVPVWQALNASSRQGIGSQSSGDQQTAAPAANGQPMPRQDLYYDHPSRLNCIGRPPGHGIAQSSDDNDWFFSNYNTHEILMGAAHPDDISGTLLLRIAETYSNEEIHEAVSKLYRAWNSGKTVTTNSITKRITLAMKIKCDAQGLDYQTERDALKARRKAFTRNTQP